VRGGQVFWALSAIEHLFDAVRQAAGLTTLTYDIIGHSAGGQFVQRLVLFVPGARSAERLGRYLAPCLFKGQVCECDAAR
jgi:pimeloyl-ACP methyl ester carboxylesterase